MHKIHIDSKSKQQLINDVHDWFKNKGFSEKKKIVLIKTYSEIIKKLSILPLIPDLLNIIKNYINDRIVIEYEHECKHTMNYENEMPEDNYDEKYYQHVLQFSTLIKSKNVYINYEKYDFEYKLHIIYDSSGM